MARLARDLFRCDQSGSYRVEFVRVRRELVDGQPWPGRDKPGHRGADVGVQVVPDEDDGPAELLVRGVQQPGVVGFGDALGPPRYRVESVAAQRGPDRGGGDLYAELEQLALDSLVAPARILCRQLDDQLLQVRGQWRPAGLAVGVGLRAGDQPPVPAQQRVGLDEEA